MATRQTLAKLAKLALENPEIRQGLTEIIVKHAQVETTDIYPNKIDHGYDEPLSGGTDVMRRLQNQFRHEQGLPMRPSSDPVPKAAGQRLPVETNIRSPYYEMTDAIGTLFDAVQEDSNVGRDRKVLDFMQDLRKAERGLYRALESKYLWD